MDIKKKLFISILSLCLVVFLAIFTLVTIFSAPNQNIKAQVSITYEVAENFKGSATINGDYLLKGDSSLTSMGASVEFTPGMQATSKSMNLSGIQLTKDKSYLCLKYTLKNTSTSSGLAISLNFDFSDQTNVTISFKDSSLDSNSYGPFSTKITSSSEDYQNVIPTLSTRYIFVNIQIADISKEASFSGAFNFTLTDA